jgi:hypothetical protein
LQGTLSGGWKGGSGDQIEEPYFTSDRWEHELKSSGFDEIDVSVHDGQSYNLIIARPPYARQRPKRLTVLYEGKKTQHIADIESRLRNEDYELDFCTVEEVPAPGQDIVSLLDLNRPWLYAISTPEFNAFKRFLAHLHDSAILWITGASQVCCRDPRFSLILGFARTIRLELQIEFVTLELENFNTAGWNAAVKVINEFGSRPRDPVNHLTNEYAHIDDRILVGRFHWFSVPNELVDTIQPNFPKTLEIGKRGLLETLQWKQGQYKPLIDDEVEIEVKSVGLNFKVNIS